MRSGDDQLEGGDTVIQVYTGKGKGKTTAALGLALRAAGAGLKIYIAQFAKGRRCCEHRALSKFKNIKIEQFGSCRFIKKITPQEINFTRHGWEKAKRAINSGKFQMIILDEINGAISSKLLEKEMVLRELKKAPRGTELILTGRDAPREIIRVADLVSQIKEVKHYFRKGVKARRGIEY